VTFTEKDISRDPEAIQELMRFGAMGTPLIVIDGQPVLGFNRQRLTELLGEGKD
jgi:glutaredoxin 3